jgi:hypothetical protein
MSRPEPAESLEQRYSSTEFLEGLAHELRGPAGVTLGALDEIELALGAEAERVRPLLLIARRGAKRLLRTADRLQLTGRLEAKRTDAEPSHVELGVLVECAARDAEELESRRGIRVSTKYPEGECMVNVDPTWLRTVIMELVGHSIRRARTSVSIAAAVEDSSVKIAIRDDGADRPKPIIRGNSTTRAGAVPGTGARYCCRAGWESFRRTPSGKRPQGSRRFLSPGDANGHIGLKKWPTKEGDRTFACSSSMTTKTRVTSWRSIWNARAGVCIGSRLCTMLAAS